MNKDFLSYLLNVLFKKMTKLTLCFFDQIVVAIGMKYLYSMDKTFKGFDKVYAIIKSNH